jgi:transcriptional regulator GlxA family with amidase domain
VRTVSIDGRKVSAAGSLGLIPDCSISGIKQTDIIIVSAPGWEVMDDIAKHPLVPWLRNGTHAAPIAGTCTGVAFCGKRNSRWPTGNHPLGCR